MDDDLRNALNEIIRELFAALPTVMEHARDVLKKHIDEDVYDHSIYTPKVYKRRSENEGMGVSLAEQTQEKPYTSIIAPDGGNVNGNLEVTTRLYYNPEGQHKVAMWSSGAGKRPEWVVNLNHNELISRIENKEPAYNWGQDKVPPRPFWQRFIDEMIDGGELEKSFVDAMSANEIIEADGSVIEDPYDRTY